MGGNLNTIVEKRLNIDCVYNLEIARTVKEFVELL